MSKLSKFLFFIVLSLFILPSAVKADMGAPSITYYEVTIINPNGIDVLDSDGQVIIHIPQGETIGISSEQMINGELYGFTSGNKTYKYFYGLVNLSDTVIATTEVDFSKLDHLEEKKELYVWGDGVYLYEGPSLKYNKSAKPIPKGTILEYEYYDEIFAYTEYNGVKGWVINYSYSQYWRDDYYEYSSGNSIVDVADKGSKVMILTDNVKLYDNNVGGKEINVQIPANTELSYKYSFAPGPRRKMVYITYNGVNGWLDVFTVGSEEAVLSEPCTFLYTLNPNGIMMYQNENGSLVSSGVTIPPHIRLQILYDNLFEYEEGKGRVYVEYNGTKGWIFLRDNTNAEENFEIFYKYNSDKYKKFRTTKEIILYEEPTFSSTKISETIKENTEVIYFGIVYNYSENDQEWFYLEQGDLRGWSALDEYDSKNDTYEGLEFIEKVNLCPISVEEIPDEDTENNEQLPTDPTNSNKLNLSPVEITIIGVVAAIVLALVSLVTIKLVNRKKKEKEVL